MTIEGQRFSDVTHAVGLLSEGLAARGKPEAAKRLVEAMAMIELESEELQACWGGPMNGQEGRQAVVLDLLRRIRFDAIVETGAFRGLTTAWLAEHFPGPVHSCEVSYRYFLQAQARLRDTANVSLAMMDSRIFLRDLFQRKVLGNTVFFYLDAHWENDLPLREELALIFAQDIRAVVMIDDFQVPDDAGYSYDDYGPGKALTLDIMDNLAGANRLFFYPAMRAASETGARRGFCICTHGMDDLLLSVPGLRGALWDTWRDKQLMIAKENDAMAEAQSTRDALAALREAFVAQHAELAHSIGLVGAASASAGAEITQALRSLAEAGGGGTELARSLRDWEATLRAFLDTADERTQLGREVVDLRAANLDLTRRLHRSELAHRQLQQSLDTEEAPDRAPGTAGLVDLQFLNQEMARCVARMEAVSGQFLQALDPVPAAPAVSPVLPALEEIQALLATLSRSRALNAISRVTQRPLATIASVREKMAALIASQRAGTPH